MSRPTTKLEIAEAIRTVYRRWIETYRSGRHHEHNRNGDYCLTTLESSANIGHFLRFMDEVADYLEEQSEAEAEADESEDG